jgi:hypothetical protein
MRGSGLLLLLLILIGSSEAPLKAARPDSIWFAPGVPGATQDGSEANPFQVSCTADIQEKLDLLDRTRRLCPIAHFLPGTYNAEDTIDVRSRITIAGSGMRSTIFRKGENNKYPYGIFQNANLGGGDQIEIQNLAIDCNLRTDGAIALYGDENTVRNVHVYNHLCRKLDNGSYSESFAILLSNRVDPFSRKWVNTSGGLVENCLITDFQGHNGGGICIAGGEDPTVATGKVRNCRVVGIENPSIPPGQGDQRWGVGATLTEGCTTENIAIGTYIEGDTGRTVIRNNHYLNCAFAGVMISVRVSSRINTIEVRNNDINLSDGGYGIFAVNNFNLNGTLKNLIAENNRITCRKHVATAEWCNIFNLPSFVLKNNIYDSSMVGRIRGSKGYVGLNRSSDGTWSTKPVRLTAPKESKTNQLKAIKAS